MSSTIYTTYTSAEGRAATRYEDADGATIALIFVDSPAGRAASRAINEHIARAGDRLVDKHTGAVLVGTLDEVAPRA